MKQARDEAQNYRKSTDLVWNLDHNHLLLLLNYTFMLLVIFS